MSMKKNVFKRALSMAMAVLMVLSCWVWFEPVETSAANLTGDSNYLFAYFTGTSIEGQTIHLAVSQDGYNYIALRNNDPVIIPSKGTGCVRDPYLWYNERDGYYYILATDLDFTDTGSDYSDNSESFIIWRSKDLVNWFDETMIDVKAMSHLIGNTDNMQSVWAPQVLHDGTSFVVYFSLQCEATKTPWGWNNLQIVYLRTTDLFDQNAYYEYGVIHDPERHVIDADIIKKPGTNQYYMFYKDESASGGIQSIYYMISDNGPTGPYYAPDNANDGRGPQLFSEIGKNLEGCNSFFDDNGNLVTYVDEYDYVNNLTNQKEAHFHVSRSSDFSTFTTLPDSSHNINTLSPRHGSVVKITDEEYNRLIAHASEITSSSFPETETLSDHLVGRYFTTSDYTYNAANGKNDLKVTDGTISATTDTSGDYYAYFNGAGAEINLAQLISGDLNIKDGFTITFSASAPSNLGSNARFFDISNNWSQRTNPNEVYLHMSPVADSNGLYVGAYNGPVTTSSWTWASQGKNYNDDVMHDYIISFADGNMILYIDGELAMKRDRFNMNAEYGDNFLTDIWYKELGNSTMRIGKSEWSDPLFTGAMQNLCIYDCALSYYDVQKMQKIFDAEAGKTSIAKIAVPETVYMTPSTGEAKTGQYYVNNRIHDGSSEVHLEVNPVQTNGVVEFYIPGAKHFIIEVSTKTSGIGDIVLGEAGRTTDNYENITYNASANGYFSYSTAGLYINGTGITPGNTALAEWKITVIMQDGSQTTHYAYTTLYAPYLNPVGSAILLKSRYSGSSGLFASSMAWVSGVHGFTNDPAANYYARTDTMVPLLGSIGTGDNEDNPDTNWISSSAGSNTLPTASFRYNKNEGQNRKFGAIAVYRSPVANLTIDTSRYSNFNQIPNLTVGYNYTDNEKADESYWYVSDYTDGDMTYMKDYSYIENRNNVNTQAGYYYNIQGQLLTNNGLVQSKVSTGEEYNAKWNRPVKPNPANGATNQYIFKTGTYSYNDAPAVGYSVNYILVNGTNVDKTELRNLVLKGTYLNESDYTKETWADYQTALQNAAKALGNPANADMSAVKTLEEKMNALQTTVTLNANGGTINGSATTTVNATVGAETSVAYKVSDYIPVRAGYIFMGWATSDDAQTGSKTTVTAGLMPTLYAVWQEGELNITFDNLIDFDAWNKVAGNGTVSDVTDTGFTITSNSGVGESTSASPYFAIEPGKKYVIQMDIIGDNWDVYFFFCNENGDWVDFKDGPSTRVSSNRSANYFERNGNTISSVFTVFDNSSIVKGQIRVDANGSSNTVRFENIRVSEAIDVSVSPVNKYVGYGETLGELPTPTRPGYEFAGWYSGNNEYTSSTVVKASSTVYLESKWTLGDAALVTDTYVLDFGIKAVFKPLDNDDILKADGASYKISGISADATNASTTLTGKYGTFTLVNDTTVEYVPTSIMKTTDIAYYHVTVGYKVLVGKMIVFPANVVNYEDDVQNAVVYTDGDASQGNTGKWSTTGTSTLGSATTDLSDKVYGYVNAYNNNDDFSMNAAHIVSVSKYNNPQAKYNGVADGEGSWPVAEFTFAGTGFDIVSLISKDTGTIQVVVTDDEGTKVADWIVDTYYGYTLQNGEWVVDASARKPLYQIPVIGRADLPYGSYTVKIIPTYTSRLDHQGDGAYDFYLDAIRVYNPMGDDPDAATVYANDGEYVVAHQSIRDILVDAKSFGESNKNQVVYINPGVPEGTFEQYSKAGPKNEVYLYKGQSIAFNMTVEGIIPSSVQVSAHALDGTAEMRFGSDASRSDSISISHKTTLYYEVPFTGAEYWIDNGNGTFTLNAPIVITNNSDSVLSLCNIKVTSDMSISNEPLLFMMSDEDFDTAVYSVRRVADLTPDDGALFVPDELSPETDKDIAEQGEEVLVTINTSKEVYALTVNGVNAVLVSENEDGSKTWNYSFVTESRGEMTFTLVAYDIHGYASEETTVTVDVQSKIEIFFNKISNFFKMIIEFIDKLF